jgi:hypothetical protein
MSRHIFGGRAARLRVDAGRRRSGGYREEEDGGNRGRKRDLLHGDLPQHHGVELAVLYGLSPPQRCDRRHIWDVTTITKKTNPEPCRRLPQRALVVMRYAGHEANPQHGRANAT